MVFFQDYQNFDDLNSLGRNKLIEKLNLSKEKMLKNYNKLKHLIKDHILNIYNQKRQKILSHFDNNLMMNDKNY